MLRPTSQEIDDQIVDRAAALFAQHGFKDTSVQRIADAVGYSKTGLLHRFPSKDALWTAVGERCTSFVRDVGARGAALTPGPERDRAVLDSLAGVAVRYPGLIALVLSSFSRQAEPGESALLDDVGDVLFAAFDVDREHAGLGRIARVVGALGALAVTALALRDCAPEDLRGHLVTVSSAALGHSHPAGPTPAKP